MPHAAASSTARRLPWSAQLKPATTETRVRPPAPTCNTYATEIIVRLGVSHCQPCSRWPRSRHSRAPDRHRQQRLLHRVQLRHEARRVTWPAAYRHAQIACSDAARHRRGFAGLRSELPADAAHGDPTEEAAEQQACTDRGQRQQTGRHVPRRRLLVGLPRFAQSQLLQTLDALPDRFVQGRTLSSTTCWAAFRSPPRMAWIAGLRPFGDEGSSAFGKRLGLGRHFAGHGGLAM